MHFVAFGHRDRRGQQELSASRYDVPSGKNVFEGTLAGTQIGTYSTGAEAPLIKKTHLGIFGSSNDALVAQHG